MRLRVILMTYIRSGRWDLVDASLLLRHTLAELSSASITAVEKALQDVSWMATRAALADQKEVACTFMQIMEAYSKVLPEGSLAGVASRTEAVVTFARLGDFDRARQALASALIGARHTPRPTVFRIVERTAHTLVRLYGPTVVVEVANATLGWDAWNDARVRSSAGAT